MKPPKKAAEKTAAKKAAPRKKAAPKVVAAEPTPTGAHFPPVLEKKERRDRGPHFAL